ncbi:MAG: hypothetical protein H0T43_08310, partial [Solirubrobacterales bacterium]|nr:hypothetical protein [Solirubrobacterales bacterium]
PAIRARASRRVAFGRALRVSGTIRPRRSRVVLEIARRGEDARQHTVARIPVKVRGGRFTTTVRLRRPALHRLRVAFRSDRRNRAGRSADVYVRAVRSRSATGGARSAGPG